MPVTIVDGFDAYNGIQANIGLQSKWAGAGVTLITLVAGRFGGQAAESLSSSTQQRYMTRTLPAVTTAVGVGVALRMTVFPTADNVHALIAFVKGTTYTLGLRVTTTGAIEVYRLTTNIAGTSLGVSAAGVITANTWHYVEFGATIHDTTGVVIIKVDGVTVLNLAAQDTNNAVTNVDTIHLGYPDANSLALGTAQFDDLYIMDASATLGERRVETLYPTSDVLQGLTRSAGAQNFALVDEAVANGDTDYVSGSVVGDRDTYGFGDLTGVPATINAVQISSFAMKTDAGARSIANQVISGATTSDGANFALAASYSKHERLMLTDPDGSVAWTAAKVNALTGGPKVTV